MLYDLRPAYLRLAAALIFAIGMLASELIANPQVLHDFPFRGVRVTTDAVHSGPVSNDAVVSSMDRVWTGEL